MAIAERLRYMLRDRWLGLVFGMWMQACGGISYAFSLYSADLKMQLNYNQEMTDGLGTSKDIGGNVGIVSGLLIDVIPAWLILLVGATMHLCGYTMLFLASTGRIRPTYWQMCMFIMVGTNGATWFNTAVLVTCIRNFQGDRGVVVGLLKGFIGLSSAIFTQVYTAIYAPHTGPFLLLCATVPPMMAVLSMLVIRPVAEVPKQKEDSDKARFYFLYIVGVTLALYLMVVILFQETFGINKAMSISFMVIMLAILFIPGSIPWQAASGPGQRGYSLIANSELLASSTPVTPEKGDTATSAGNFTKSPIASAADGAGKPSTTKTTLLSNNDTPSKTRRPRVGQDHSLLQAATTEDYWLLFFAMGCGTGSGLTAINNLAQMADSLGSKSVGAFVSLVSVWNFLGRMGAGYLSEHYVKRYGTPRPLFMLLVQAVMACAHLLFASGISIMLYLGSALVGMAHGAHWTLMVATASELFGLRHFGALYNTLSISATLGSYMLSVKLAGYVYDQQVAAEKAEAALKGLSLSEDHRCTGPQCFRPTFLIMAGVCCVGICALARLVSRTRKMYQDMHKLQQVKDILRIPGLQKDRMLLPSTSMSHSSSPMASAALLASNATAVDVQVQAPENQDNEDGAVPNMPIYDQQRFRSNAAISKADDLS
eukprot:SM000017S02796  [mRNA]  locus=s17:307703:312742:+ [translate_table: standard]